MQDPFVGEIMTFAGNFVPRGFAACDGSLRPISQNTALFSLLGTSYGGDGRTTFALPDVRGRALLNAGAGPGLSPRTVGEASGAEKVTLTVTQMPSHNHPVAGQPLTATGTIPKASVTITSSSSVKCNSSGTSSNSPQGAYPGDGGSSIWSGSADSTMATDMVTTTSTVTNDIPVSANLNLSGVSTGLVGGGQPVPTMSPFLCITYCIATEGIFPSRP